MRITLIDRTNHHLFQPLLYQVATGILSEGQIAPAIRDVLRNYPSLRVILGEVEDIDVEAREVHVDEFGKPLTIGYDSLIVAGGASSSYFGHDEFRAASCAMKTLDDALALRGNIFGAFELAEAETDPEERRRLMTFVVVGGGPTGVEMAGQLRELSRRALRRNYRMIDPVDTRVVLVEGARPARRLHGDVPVAHDGTRPHPHGRGDPPDATGDRPGRRGRRDHQAATARPSGSPPPPRSGPPARAPRVWAPSSPAPPGRRPTRPAGSWSVPTARSPPIPRCSSWAT